MLYPTLQRDGGDSVEQFEASASYGGWLITRSQIVPVQKCFSEPSQ